MALQASPKASMRKLFLTLSAIALGCHDKGGRQISASTLIAGKFHPSSYKPSDPKEYCTIDHPFTAPALMLSLHSGSCDIDATVRAGALRLITKGLSHLGGDEGLMGQLCAAVKPRSVD